jgi:uncharacterized protein YciI
MLPFVFKLVPPRPDFAFTMSDEERATTLDHLRYWGELTAAGRTVGYGPVDDPSGGYGIGIVLADSVEAAERLRDDDPAMRSPQGSARRSSPCCDS